MQKYGQGSQMKQEAMNEDDEKPRIFPGNGKKPLADRNFNN